MSAQLPEGTVHLVAADDALTEHHQYRTYLAVCGALLPASSLPRSSCPCECDCEVRYCSVCLSAAGSWNAEAGQAAGGAR